MSPPDNLLTVSNLKKYFPVKQGLLAQFFSREKLYVRAVDGVSFSVHRGETLGLVGESGCGKTTTGMTILQLSLPTGGAVLFEGQNIVGLSQQEIRNLRQHMQMIFQNPFSSLNPRMKVAEIIAEPLKNYGLGTKQEQEERIRELLEHVGLSSVHGTRYPHEFSGGQRQRIGIARALALNPKLIIADEPVSALDVSVQAQILNLLLKLKADFHLTYLFISHDLSVIRYISDRIAVMYLGEIVEIARADALYKTPLHPYTQALMSAIPEPNPRRKKKRVVLHGGVPSPLNPPSGCRFHPRCPIAVPECSQVKPELRSIGNSRQVRCHLIT
jgi:oligopeptide/dipeptide ABC transporter ATP-binding protein